jgi:hypothetical protein
MNRSLSNLPAELNCDVFLRALLRELSGARKTLSSLMPSQRQLEWRYSFPIGRSFNELGRYPFADRRGQSSGSAQSSDVNNFTL